MKTMHRQVYDLLKLTGHLPCYKDFMQQVNARGPEEFKKACVGRNPKAVFSYYALNTRQNRIADYDMYLVVSDLLHGNMYQLFYPNTPPTTVNITHFTSDNGFTPKDVMTVLKIDRANAFVHLQGDVLCTRIA